VEKRREPGGMEAWKLGMRLHQNCGYKALWKDWKNAKEVEISSLVNLDVNRWEET
jgi:hypothetical protein